MPVEVTGQLVDRLVQAGPGRPIPLAEDGTQQTRPLPHFHTWEVFPEPGFQAVAAVGQPDPAVGPVHADVRGGRADQRSELFQGGTAPRGNCACIGPGFSPGARNSGVGLPTIPT